MAWPTDAVATGELITAAQFNGLPVMIANSTLGADAANIDFQSIPSHYAHLMLECYLRSDTAAAAQTVMYRLNNDSAGNYDYQFVAGSAAVASAGETFASGVARIGTMPANTAGANLFCAVTAVFPHYANTANNKAAESQSAHKSGTASGNLESSAWASFWRSNSAINRITILGGAGNLKSGSRVTLYGLA